MSQELIEQLSALKKLLDDGLITAEDYENQKTEVLRHLSQARFTSGPSPAAPDLGGKQTLGAYILSSTIGAGGMGTVYRGRHRSAEKSQQQGGDVAIKVLHPQYARQPAYRERFEREAAVGLRMDHPNIVRVFDLIVDGETLGLVMELVEGRELSDIIGKTVGPMPWVQASRIFRQILDAIECVHLKGVVHRDIKPENLMVSGDAVKLMDFGIAKDVSKSKTRTGTSMGTVAYMAPEQFLSARNVDERADIYALGMTLYEMLAGRLPWDESAQEFAILKLKESGAYPGPETFYPHIPQHVLTALSAMLRMEPAQRLSSIAAVRSALFPEEATAQEEELHLDTEEEEVGDGGVRLDDAPVVAPSLPGPASETPIPEPSSLPRKSKAGPALATSVMFGLLAVGSIGVCAGVPLIWHVMNTSQATEKLEASLERLERFKTDAVSNKDTSLLSEARLLAHESAEINRTPEALGAEALAAVWLHEWHYPRTAWNERIFNEDLSLVQGALSAGESPEARLAEALLQSAACRLNDGVGGWCADGDAAYAAVLGTGERWLQLEAAWTRAMFLNDRAALSAKAGDTEASRRLHSEATALCDRSAGLREPRWVNSGELSRECAQARSSLGDASGWLSEVQWMVDNLRNAEGQVGSEITQRLWGTPAPECVGIPWHWSQDFGQYIPKFRWSTQPELSFCYYAGLLALNCPHMASEVRALGRFEAKNLAWTEMMHAWSAAHPADRAQRCEMDGLSLPTSLQGLFAESVNWSSSGGETMVLQDDGEYQLVMPCDYGITVTLRGGWEVRHNGDENSFYLWASIFSASGGGQYFQNPQAMFSQGDSDKLRFRLEDDQLVFAGSSLSCGLSRGDRFHRVP